MTMKVGQKNNYDYSTLKVNSKYVIKTTEGKDIINFEYHGMTDQLIMGLKDEQKIEVNKTSILHIKKYGTGKTIAIVGGVAVLGLLIPSYISNSPVGQ